MRIITVLTLMLGTAATPASAQVLWQNVAVGMSLEQVRVSQPSAITNPTPSTLHDKSSCGLQIKSYRVSEQEFTVCFYFKNAHLKQVTLQAEAPTVSLFESMQELLRAKYGAELAAGHSSCEKAGYLRTCDAAWVLPTGANVSLLYMDVNGDVPLLNINYQRRVKEESGKL